MDPRSGTPREHAAAQLTTYGQRAEMVLLIGGHLQPRATRHGVSIAETQVGTVRDSVDKGSRGFRISGDSDEYFVKVHTALDRSTRRKVPHRTRTRGRFFLYYGSRVRKHSPFDGAVNRIRPGSPPPYMGAGAVVFFAPPRT